MKKVLCILLCLMLSITAAMAETADTLQKLLVRQLTAGYGLRGYASITAFGEADWLNYLLPFTPTDIQIRAIGEKQGAMSESISDDDDWQIRFYVQNAADEEVGTSWLYGDPEGVYFQSELLPDTLLTVPVDQVNLLYQLMRGDLQELFFAFDPLSLTAPGENGTASSYEALAKVLGVPAEDWESSWLPVLEKYFLQLDLWLTSYGDPSFVTGESGALTMSGTYTIPAEDLKTEAKYLIGQMLYDNDLLSLLLPYVTLEERVTYLNPTMVYFYEACIDALPLEGDVILSREMSAMGEIVSTTVSLPIPPLPDEVIAPVGQAAAELLDLTYTDLLSSMNRIVLTQTGAERSLTLSGEKRTISIAAAGSAAEENAVDLKGTIRITPNIGVEENYLSAAFTCSASHRVWQDEKYVDHDTSAFAITIQSDLTPLAEDDPFRSAYADFAPISLSWSVDYLNDPYKNNSPVQININTAAQLPDAEITAKIVLRITTQMQMQQLSTDGAEDFTRMTEERKNALLGTFMENAVLTMANLSAETPESTATPTGAPASESDAAPPAAE